MYLEKTAIGKGLQATVSYNGIVLGSKWFASDAQANRWAAKKVAQHRKQERKDKVARKGYANV